jgi:hypothetical protein
VSDHGEVRSGKKVVRHATAAPPEAGEELETFVADLTFALLERDIPEIKRLLRSELAGQLPPEVRSEAVQFSRLQPGSARAPIHTLRFAHRLHELNAGLGSTDPDEQIDLFSG